MKETITVRETVTVDEAIAKGYRMINYPVLGIMFATSGLCFYLGAGNILPFWIIPAGFILAVGLGWLYWSVMITKWRIWAFENVRNVHELKKRAVQEKLIWPDDSIFEKTEIRTTVEKQKIKSLRGKFSREDIFHDDVTVPAETIIYYARGRNLMEMIIMLVCLAGGIYMLATTERYVVGTAVSVIGAFFGYREFKEATSTEPQIIINQKGIQTVSTRFYAWKDIGDEEAVSEGTGKSTRWYLTYSHPEGFEKLQIDEYATELTTLNKLLILYRGRNKNQKNYR